MIYNLYTDASKKNDYAVMAGVVLGEKNKPLCEFIIKSDSSVATDKLERKAIKNHMNRTREGKCVGSAAVIYVDIISDIERIGDHAVNIVEHYTYKDLVLTPEEEDLDLSKFIIE